MTFNVEGKFSNTQLALLFDLPTAEILSNWCKIKVLKAPLGIKEIEFHEQRSKESYLNEGFVEVMLALLQKELNI